MSMSLGVYSLEHYPSNFTPPRPFRSNAYQETYGGVDHFSWGFFTAGQIIELEWSFMPSQQFDSLDAIFQGDEETIWDPGIPGEGETYTVQILDFTGEFHEEIGSGTEIWRKNCKMTILVMEVIPESS